MTTLSDALKEAAGKHEWSIHAIAIHIGVSPSTLNRFVRSETLPLTLGDKLALFLRLELGEKTSVDLGDFRPKETVFDGIY